MELSGTVKSNSGKALTALCVAGAGIFISPSVGVYEELRTRQLVPVLADYELVSFGLYVRYPSRLFLPAKVRCFLETLQAHFGDDPQADPWWPATPISS